MQATALPQPEAHAGSIQRFHQLVPPKACWPPKLFGYDRSESPHPERKSPQSAPEITSADESVTHTRRKPRINLAKLQIGLGQGNALDPPHLRIRRQQQIQLRL